MRTISFTIVDDNGVERDVELPARWAICTGRCRGEGTHDAWDNGMTRNEMDEQGPEFIEDYLSGTYDVPCRSCRGTGKVLVPDEDRAAPADLEAYHEHLAEEREYRLQAEAEIRAGC